MKSLEEIIKCRDEYRELYRKERVDREAPKGFGYYAGILSALDWVLDYKEEKEKTL